MQLYKRVSLKKETGLLPICQNEIQGLFKDFQGPYEGYHRLGGSPNLLYKPMR